MRFDDETLMAYADGQLPPGEAKRVEAAMADDAALAARVARFRNVRRALKLAYDSVTREPVPEHLRALLGDVASSEPPASKPVLDFSTARATLPVKAQAPRFGPPAWAAMAASLIVGVLAGRLLLNQGDQLFDTRDGQIYAGARLAQVLDTRLASDVANVDAGTRIGISFRTQSGEYCRTFVRIEQEHGVSGLACRDAGGWSVRVTSSEPAAGGAYRQAGSAAPAVLAMVDQLIAGDTLDENEERAARDQRWRSAVR
jgi:hypothetical protein